MAVTPESFLELLQKSKLLTAEKFAAARELAREVQSKDPRALAKSLVLKDLLTRWQAAHLLAGRSSFFMGKYKLIDQIGRGGMGGVFLVEHTMMNRTAALKVISRQLGKDPALLERFLTEARTIAALDHANIAHAYDVDKEGDRYYLVMEYIEGHDLQRLVDEEGPLDCEQAADFVRQAAEGLAHAHAKGMVHCDIKPANLLVNRQGVVKILDMGMARLVGRGRNGSDSDDRFMGTVDYMAPEQALDSPNLDHRVDIYSLGCTLYFLLTGQAPFPEGSIHERIVKHQTQEPRAIRELRPEVPKDLVEICRKMMAKEPADRYQTAAELSQILADWRPPPSQKIKRAVPLEEAGEAAVVEPDDGDAALALPADSHAGKGAKFQFLVEKFQVAVAKSKVLLADRRRAAWVGGVGVAVLLVIVGLVWALGGKSHDSHTAVASKKGASAETGAKAPAKETPDSDPTATKDKKDSEETAAAGKKSAAESEDKAAKKEPEREKSSEAKTAKGTPKSADETGKVLAKTEKADDKPAGKVVQKPAAKAKSDAKSDKAAEKKTDKPKAETPKPAVSVKPKPKPPADPFKDLPTAVDLPAEPGELGKIHVPAGVAWDLDLENGDKVLRGNRHFTKPASKDEGGKPTWIVQLNTPSASKDKEDTLTDIAKFSRDGESLQFEWMEGAPAALAGHLRLCTLKVRVGDNERSVALLKPQVLEPLALNLDRMTSASKVPVPWLPDPTRTRVQIVKVEGVKDCAISPQDPVPLSKKITLSFPQMDVRTKAERVGLELTLIASAKGSNALNFTVQLPRTLSYLPGFFKSATQDPNIRIEMERKVQEWNRSLEKPGSMKPQQQKETELKADSFGNRVWLIDLYTASKMAKVHFRVLAEVGDQEVEVATTGAAPQSPK